MTKAVFEGRQSSPPFPSPSHAGRAHMQQGPYLSSSYHAPKLPAPAPTVTRIDTGRGGGIGRDPLPPPLRYTAATETNLHQFRLLLIAFNFSTSGLKIEYKYVHTFCPVHSFIRSFTGLGLQLGPELQWGQRRWHHPFLTLILIHLHPEK